MCQCSTSTFEDSCERVVLIDMPESRDVTEQINWRRKKAAITSGLCLGRSEVAIEDLESTCEHKAKDITPSIAWRRWSSLKGRERAIVDQTNIGNVSEASWRNLV